MTQSSLPRDPRRLLREASARISVRDIKRQHDLRESMAVKWWEQLIWLMIFPTALGLLLTLSNMIEMRSPEGAGDRMFDRFVFVWAALFVLVLTVSMEIVSNRHRAMRRYLEELRREVEAQSRDLAVLRRELERRSSGSKGP